MPRAEHKEIQRPRNSSGQIAVTIRKSEGTTPTEKLLADLCEKTFLKLWSYPNPFKDDRKELCDVLVVFENHVLIFFDRANSQLEKLDRDPLVSWGRWKKNSIDAQISTAKGAERYLRSARKVYLDGELKVPFPIPIQPEQMIVHKIVVAHGANEACKYWSENNVSGSLAMAYSAQSEDQRVVGKKRSARAYDRAPRDRNSWIKKIETPARASASKSLLTHL